MLNRDRGLRMAVVNLPNISQNLIKTKFKSEDLTLGGGIEVDAKWQIMEPIEMSHSDKFQVAD